MNIFKRIFCKHKNIYWVRNIYGDEINDISSRHIYRSIWRCKDCGRTFYKEILVKQNENSMETF